MVEYIDREKLIVEYDRVHIGVAGGARKLMVDAPAEDVVPVVKCSQCRKRYTTECALWYGTVNDQEYFVERGEDFYCSYGEMK